MLTRSFLFFCMINGLYALCLWTSTDGCVFVKAYQTKEVFVLAWRNGRPI